MSREPQQLGSYRLTQRIVTGEFSETWRARTVGAAGFERMIAVKCVLPSYASSVEFLERLTSEATLAAQLSHANIVQLFDFDLEGGQYFLAMEYVEGKNLSDVLLESRRQQKPLGIWLSTHIVCELLKALTYAHERKGHGIYHLDITPRNILLSFQGEVKLSSFGLGDTPLLGVEASLRKGRAAYCSPEQLSRVQLDARSDLFSLGVVFYELLTGKPCFAGDDVVRAVQQQEVPVPSSYVSEIPEWLDQFVLSLLQKDPALRPQQTRAAMEVLADFLHEHVKSFHAVDLMKYLGELFPSDAEELEKPGTDRLPGRQAGGERLQVASSQEQTGALQKSAVTARRWPIVFVGALVFGVIMLLLLR
jgi:serine/threonine protein kinase